MPTWRVRRDGSIGLEVEGLLTEVSSERTNQP
jgi:hypothetical protein